MPFLNCSPLLGISKSETQGFRVKKAWGDHTHPVALPKSPKSLNFKSLSFPSLQYLKIQPAGPPVANSQTLWPLQYLVSRPWSAPSPAPRPHTLLPTIPFHPHVRGFYCSSLVPPKIRLSVLHLNMPCLPRSYSHLKNTPQRVLYKLQRFLLVFPTSPPHTITSCKTFWEEGLWLSWAMWPDPSPWAGPGAAGSGWH